MKSLPKIMWKLASKSVTHKKKMNVEQLRNI